MENGEKKVEHAPSIELVRATTDDTEAYIALEKSLGETETYSTMDTPDEALKNITECTTYFIKEDGVIVGSVSYVMKSPDHAYIDGLLVMPPHQGRGLGRAAMLKILEEIGDVRLIDLVTHPDNATSIKLYQSLGFTIGERIENYFGDGEPRIVMTLNR
ncbi:MAG: GNAT family N-acetyltransferase [Patescibacteria group bacterium]|nr:GNAT family N-acetyltransferase [Patescibacteria group bacterium]